MAVREKSSPQTPAVASISKADWKSILLMMVNPAGVLKQRMASISSVWALAVSGSAFAIFFLQTGLDLHRNGEPASLIAVLAAVGMIYGTVVVAAIALIAWSLTRVLGGGRSAGWSVKAFALGYSPALIYASLGLLANLILSWNTAIAFGVTGMLWALGPMVAATKEMTDQKVGISILVATLCGGLLLVGWSALSLGIGWSA